jgi:DNA-binding MarR family transcriptional regulator
MDIDFNLEQFTAYQFAVVANRMSQSIAVLFEQEFQIQIPDWRILIALLDREFMTFKEVVESTSMDKSRVSRAYKRLESINLIEVTEGPFDKRQVVMRLTTDGRQMCYDIIPKAQERNDSLLETLTEAERTELDAILKKLLLRTKNIVSNTDMD